MSNLPTPSSAQPASEIDAWDLWDQVVSEVKKRIMQPSFWQALETVIPITIEGSVFVVGLPSAAGYYAGHLTGSENRNRLERIIEELTQGVHLDLRVIEGSEENDWENVKRREQAAKDAQQAFRNRFDSPQPGAGRGTTWESLQERIYAMFSRSQGHHLAQGRAHYLVSILPVLADESQKIIDANPHDADRNERALARIIDRVAGLAEVPSTVVALELLRYQHQLKRKKPDSN